MNLSRIDCFSSSDNLSQATSTILAAAVAFFLLRAATISSFVGSFLAAGCSTGVFWVSPLFLSVSGFGSSAGVFFPAVSVFCASDWPFWAFAGVSSFGVSTTGFANCPSASLAFSSAFSAAFLASAAALSAAALALTSALAISFFELISAKTSLTLFNNSLPFW